MSATQTVVLEIQKTDKEIAFLSIKIHYVLVPRRQLHLMEVKQFVKMIRMIPIKSMTVAV